MNKRRVVEISPRAAGELETARRWWHENRDKAPSAVADDLGDTVQLAAVWHASRGHDPVVR